MTNVADTGLGVDVLCFKARRSRQIPCTPRTQVRVAEVHTEQQSGSQAARPKPNTSFTRSNRRQARKDLVCKPSRVPILTFCRVLFTVVLTRTYKADGLWCFVPPLRWSADGREKIRCPASPSGDS